MKSYLFLILEEGTNGNIFRVKASSENEARDIFAKLALPLLKDSIDYTTLVDILNSYDVMVEFIGDESTQLINLNE